MIKDNQNATPGTAPDQTAGAKGAVLVIGGGIAGIQAALDLAEAGQKVYLVESSPAIGGNMARLDKTFPTNDCSMCILSPKIVECGRHLNIELITLGELRSLEGTAGRFLARVLRRARYVDPGKCTGCGVCLEQCPVRYVPRFRRRVPEPQLSPEQSARVERLIARHGRTQTALMRVLQELNAEQRKLRAVYSAGLRAYALFQKGMIADSQLRTICGEIQQLDTDIRKYQGMAKNFAKRLRIR